MSPGKKNKWHIECNKGNQKINYSVTTLLLKSDTWQMVCECFIMRVITPDLSFFWCFIINQSVCLHCLHSSFWWPLSSQMQWIRWPRWPSGCRQIACRHSLQLIYLVFQTSQHMHIATCSALHKTSCLRGMYHSATAVFHFISFIINTEQTAAFFQ